MSLPIGIIKRAIQECEKSTYRIQVAAVIFKGSRIISSACNDTRCNSIHPKYQDYPQSFHAEQKSLLGLDWSKLKGYSILVVRVNKQGNLRYALPCKKCQKLLAHVRISNIYYSSKCGEILHTKLERILQYD